MSGPIKAERCMGKKPCEKVMLYLKALGYNAFESMKVMTHFKQIKHWMRRNISQMVTSVYMHVYLYMQ